MEVAPTRWIITGLELERGMILSQEMFVLAERAAKDEENSGIFSSISVKTFFDMYEQQHPLITNPLAQFDCLPCDKGVKDEEVE
eukprot:2322362-Ditylum_brightwellii.AAC.1